METNPTSKRQLAAIIFADIAQAACYALLGDEQKAREIMHNLPKECVEYHSMQAYGFIGLNELDSAAYHLDLALDNFEVNAFEMLHHPIYQSFQEHPSFPILLKKAGLYSYWEQDIKG